VSCLVARIFTEPELQHASAHGHLAGKQHGEEQQELLLLLLLLYHQHHPKRTGTGLVEGGKSLNAPAAAALQANMRSKWHGNGTPMSSLTFSPPTVMASLLSLARVSRVSIQPYAMALHLQHHKSDVQQTSKHCSAPPQQDHCQCQQQR
jgi:hypothetical protein